MVEMDTLVVVVELVELGMVVESYLIDNLVVEVVEKIELGM